MDLKITQLSFTLIPIEKINLPRYPGSTLRGAFGHALRKLTCCYNNIDCVSCSLNQMCAYACLFNPIITEEEKERTSSRFNNKPRPFVFLPETNEQEVFYSGQKINFDFIIFGSARKYLPYIIEAWKVLENEGLGNGRGKFIVSEIWAKNDLTGFAERMYTEYANVIHNSELYIDNKDVERLKEELSLSCLRITFCTPTLLKDKGIEVDKVEFHILMKNLYRRLSALSAFYGEESLDIKFDKYIERSKKIILKQDHTSWQTWERFSGRQNRRIKMKGLVGGLKYEGDLEEFLPYIILGQYIHVGKNTVFGLGRYKVIKY